MYVVETNRVYKEKNMHFIITQKEIEKMLEISKNNNNENLFVNVISTPIIDSIQVLPQSQIGIENKFIDITDWESA